MKRVALFSLFIFIYTSMLAQTNNTIPGEYYLRGVMEVGSGFRFNADHSFNFFYAYGAIDREASGTWTQLGDSLILNNTKKPSKDFKLLQQQTNKNNKITIKISCENKMLLSNIYAEIKCGDTTYREQSSQEGIITIPKGNIQSIALIHAFWPDRFSVFDTIDAGNNYFEFEIEKWIGDVDFDNFVLQYKDSGLTGNHPLLEKKEYTYVKSKADEQ